MSATAMPRGNAPDPVAYARAKKRAEAKVGLFIHLAVWAVVSVALVVINLATSSGYLWAAWPIAGWGIGVLLHTLRVFGPSRRSRLVERMIEHELGNVPSDLLVKKRNAEEKP